MNVFRTSTTAAWMAFIVAMSSSFDVVAGFQPSGWFALSRRTRKETSLYSLSSLEQEQKLLQEIADKNTIVKDEAEYGVADGANMAQIYMKDDELAKAAAAQIANATDGRLITALDAKLVQLTKPRPYSLLAFERIAEFFEGMALGMKIMRSPRIVESPYLKTFAPTRKQKREQIVVLGTGWGAMAFLKAIDCTQNDVTVISPRNHFLFTPMLAGASVGTVEFRSITEPVREINNRADYLEATATTIDAENQVVYCQSVVCDATDCEIEDFEVKYDRLLMSIGAQSNTLGVPGVREYCCFLRTVEDAVKLRSALINCFERANLPGLSDQERINCLTFVVIGAGPTGAEFASELRDFVEQEGPVYYRKLLRFIRIRVISASNSVLSPFDEMLQKQAMQGLVQEFKMDSTSEGAVPHNFKPAKLMLDRRAKAITEDVIKLDDGTSLRYGMAVWAAGNGPLPLTLDLISSLGELQENEQKVARGRLAVDPWMRVIGSGGTILACGDCSCVTTGPLPAAADVAAQQGEFVASMFNKNLDLNPTFKGQLLPPLRDMRQPNLLPSDVLASYATKTRVFAKPFQYFNLGLMAYTGSGSPVSHLDTASIDDSFKARVDAGDAVWKNLYLTKQISWRNRLLVFNDWVRLVLFGRDITRMQ